MGVSSSGARAPRCGASVSPACLVRAVGYQLHSPRQCQGGRRRSLLQTLAVAQGEPGSSGKDVDLVLSSGFLAFANHCGFLQAVDETDLRVRGVMGTSAGALAGSLYCAGYVPADVARELSAVPPIRLLRPSWTPWRGGVLSLNKVIRRLSDLLPPTFEDLDVEFAVGVVGMDGEYRVVDSGPLPEAVAASAAIPLIFSAVNVDGGGGRPFKDGGVADRVGLKGWRERRRLQVEAGSLGMQRPPTALVHLIGRSSPFSGADDVKATGERDVVLVQSPRSGVSFFDLGDFEGQMSGAYIRALPPVSAVAGRPTSALGALNNCVGDITAGSGGVILPK